MPAKRMEHRIFEKSAAQKAGRDKALLLLPIYPRTASRFQQCKITAVYDKPRIFSELYTFIGAFCEALYSLLILDAAAKLLREQSSIRGVRLVRDSADDRHIWRNWEHIVEAKGTDDLPVICNDQEIVGLLLLIGCNRDVIFHIVHTQHNAAQEFLFTFPAVLRVGNTAESSLGGLGVFQIGNVIQTDGVEVQLVHFTSKAW